MGNTLTLLGIASGCGLAAYAWRQVHLRETARLRLEAIAHEAVAEAPARRLDTRFAHRHYLLPWLIAAMVAVVLHWVVGLDVFFTGALGVMVGLLGGLIDSMWLARVESRIEQQLADSIDLMVGALHAGSSVPAAIESALSEARWPLREQFEEVLGRLRYGDEPLGVFAGLTERVPLENFRLFAATMSVHFEVGGSLAPTLATVGRTIRDRIDVARRVHSMTAQSRASTMAILGVTYFIALVMWRSDPDRMREFIANPIGKILLAGALVLQAIGIVWTSRIGRKKLV
jgi:Flp pilus assembly protein TadB